MIVALAAGISLAAAGCGPDGPAATSIDTGSIAGSGVPIEPQGVAAATVRLRSVGCGPRTELGTGTVIEHGLVITAAHVVAGSDHVTVAAPGGNEIATDVVLFDPDLDLAVLRLPTPISDVATLRAEPANEGEQGLVATVTSEGVIELIEVEVLRTVTVRTTDIYRAADVERPGFEIDAAIEPGDSGAMVHLPGGGVGVVWSRSTVNADRAWAADLPPVLQADDEWRSLTTAVDTGPCL